MREAKQRVSQDPPDDGLVGQGGGNKTRIQGYRILVPHLVAEHADHDPWGNQQNMHSLDNFS
jgi:hypothetical protein